MVIGTDLLDQSSTNSNPQYVQQGIRLNLHCWHTEDRFSKFAFKMGHYKQSELEKYRNDTTAQAYVRKKSKTIFYFIRNFFYLRQCEWHLNLNI